MTAFRHALRRHQIARFESQQHRVEQASARAHAMLGAYGLSLSGQSVTPSAPRR